MFDQMEVFRLSGAMAEHSSRRQTVAAANIAQADTPGYRALAVESFADAHAADGFAMRATRASHLHGAGEDRAPRIVEARGATASADGNTVSLEAEMAAGVGASSDHNRALAVYRHGLTVLRASFGGR